MGDAEVDCFRVAVALDVEGTVLCSDRLSAVKDTSKQGRQIVPESLQLFSGRTSKCPWMLVTDGGCVGFVVKGDEFFAPKQHDLGLRRQQNIHCGT